MSHFQIIDNVLIKHEKEKDKLRMAGGSWSINLDEIRKRPETIQYITEEVTYTISYKDAYLYGFMRILGGEHKLVVLIKHWTKEQRL